MHLDVICANRRVRGFPRIFWIAPMLTRTAELHVLVSRYGTSSERLKAVTNNSLQVFALAVQEAATQ